MPVQIIHDSGRACPFLICDECAQPITAHRSAIIAWDIETPASPRFLHKGTCDRRFHEGRASSCWENLGDWLVMLSHNAGLRRGRDFDQIRREQEELAGLGL
jgi:hypothetical protein